MKNFLREHRYVTILSIALFTQLAGRMFSRLGMQWYNTLNLPWFTPPGYVFGIAWTLITVCATTCALIIFDARTSTKHRTLIATWFIVNATLNASWTYLFFARHLILASFCCAMLLFATTLILIHLCWKNHRVASLLLTPYAAWLIFALYLNYFIWKIN